MNLLQSKLNEGACTLAGIPERDYHGFFAMSASGMKEFKKAPGYWKWRRENPSDDTQARLEGRLVHMALGEPERFETTVKVVDGRRTDSVKEEVSRWATQGYTVCKSDDLTMARNVAAYARSHPLLRQILSSGQGEQTILWSDPETNVPCKARLDWVTPSGVICDFKTFGPIWDDDEIERQIRSNAYQFQAAWYLEGYYRATGKRAKAFYNAFIRHDDPIDVRIIEISTHSLEETLPYISRVLSEFKECIKSGIYPMSATEVTQIEIKPYWR